MRCPVFLFFLVIFEAAVTMVTLDIQGHLLKRYIFGSPTYTNQTPNSPQEVFAWMSMG